MSAGQIGSWQSAEYVGRWAGEDVVARLLETPRRISISLLEDAGLDVRHVVDLGSGEGPYLADLLRAFPKSSGTSRRRVMSSESASPTGGSPMRANSSVVTIIRRRSWTRRSMATSTSARETSTLWASRSSSTSR